MAKNKDKKDSDEKDDTAATPETSAATLAPPVPPTPAADPGADATEVINLTYQLLASIINADWNAYVALCDQNITCFEPEAKGHLIEGLAFHKFYFDLGPSNGPRSITLLNLRVRMMGDSALVCYSRVTQSLNQSSQPQTSEMEETRVWTKINGAWKHVHFHRSPGA